MILGRIRLLACPYVPDGMLPCAGQTITAQDNPDLVFAVTEDRDATSITIPALEPWADGVRWAMDVTGVVPWDGTRAQTDPPYIGELITFMPANAATYPAGELIPCDGRILDQVTHMALGALLGTTFGGVDFESFAVPDVASPAPAMPYFIVGEAGVYPAPGQDWPA